MPRSTSIKTSGFIGIPKDMNKVSWMVEIIDHNNVTHDVTEYITKGDIQRIATDGLSNFNITLDNNNGRYKGFFAAGNFVNVYYDYKEKSELSVIRFRGYVDGVYDNFNLISGFELIIEGRDAPKSSNNEHFADTHITIQKYARNNLDWWFGTTGDIDNEGNYEDGVLYNSGLILKVYDTSDSSWKAYKDLTEEQRYTLKGQEGYTQTHNSTYVDKSRLTISKTLAIEGDYDFRIYYDSNDGYTYLMVHPEEAVLNSDEHVSAGQNIIALNRYGKDTSTEYNRIKESGFSDGTLMLMKTKQDIDRQALVWIKDKEETTAALTDIDEVDAKATARLNELKEALNKGGITCCGLPSLQPGEKIPVNLPYVMNANVKVNSFNINFGGDLMFDLDLQDRETRFENIFKDRIDENINITPTDNPRGFRNGLIYDFSDSTDYSLSDCEIVDNVLSLQTGKISGVCTIDMYTADEDVAHCELRILANGYKTTTYRISNNNGLNWGTITPGVIYEFTSVGNQILLEITLNQQDDGGRPNFNKVNILYK